MTRRSIWEYLEAIRGRYLWADKKEKGKTLDEAEQVTESHREALIRVLGRKGKVVAFPHRPYG